jgi:putative DNA primase/helicase
MEVKVEDLTERHPDKGNTLVRGVSSAKQHAAGGSKLELIMKMHLLGCAVFPVVAGGKTPSVSGGVHARSKNPKQIKKYFQANASANYGVAMGAASNTFAVDLDGMEGVRNFRRLEEKYGRCQPTLTVRTPHGLHLYFRPPKRRVPNSTSRIAKGVDIKGDGGYVVGPGSTTADGVYRFARGRGPNDVKIAEAPAWLLKMLAPRPTPADESTKPVEIPEGHRERALKYADAARQRELERLAKAPKHQRNNTLNLCAFKLGQFLPHGLLDRNSAANELAQVASRIGLDTHEIRPTIESGLNAGARHPRRLAFLKEPAQRVVVPPSPKKPDDIAERLAKLGETDTDNAQRFATRFGRKVIFTLGRGWLVFDGIRYKPDAQLQAVELAKQTARGIRAELQFMGSDHARAARARFARESLSKGSLERMLDLAKSLLVVEDSKLDSDPMLFNTLSGTIDLRTGELDKHDPRDLLTKLAPVNYDPKAKCANFKRFLRHIHRDDAEYTRYMQKAAGYTLTGDISEQVLFFAHGPGNTGKSTFINTLRDMMGDYGAHTPTETLLAKQNDNAIPADLARLAGARMVSAIEANFNRRLDEARIKGMTGGEPITARFMRHNFFQYAPNFKLWLGANDLPRVRSTDTAFWRRVRVLPFVHEVPPSERDREFPKKLKAEWPGILAWAVRGCLKWQAEGLAEPASVRRATAQWQKQVDHIKIFADEMLTFAPGESTQAKPMYEAYKRWCRQNGEQHLSVSDFKQGLSEGVSLPHKRVHGVGWWKGVKLRTS